MVRLIMLTPDEEKYLLTIPSGKTAHILGFDPRVQITTKELMAEIKKILPERQVLFQGAAALGIAGQNDVDLNVLSRPQDYSADRPKLEKIFGKPAKANSRLVKWEFGRGGFEVELYLTDRNSPDLLRQIRVFELLRDNSTLAKEYEQMKLACNGLPFAEYMRKKFEFFHRILGEDR